MELRQLTARMHAQLYHINVETDPSLAQHLPNVVETHRMCAMRAQDFDLRALLGSLLSHAATQLGRCFHR
jgi:hypothetical protein